VRIALVDYHVSAGGVSRFLTALTLHLALRHPEVEFTLLARAETIDRDGLRGVFEEQTNVTVSEFPMDDRVQTTAEDEAAVRSRGKLRRRLTSALKKSRWLFDAALRVYRFYSHTIRGVRGPWYKFGFTDEALALLRGFDLVYLAWPFFLQPVEVGVPVVATFHDLNFKHFPDSYNPEILRIADTQTEYWLRASSAVIASTRFIADDLHRHYPNAVTSVDVVPLAPYSYEGEPPSAEVIAESRATHGLPERFAIYSGGGARHKNILGLLQALDILKRRGDRIPLVITGIGTEVIGRGTSAVTRESPAHEINEFIESSSLEVGRDVFALGYVSNQDVDALTHGASLVVSPSRYEAGCGPAMDAWQFGVPVAFSNIPPFLEQLQLLGAEAWVFDPEDPEDIARVLQEFFDSPEKAREMASRSRDAIMRRTWDDVADGYFGVFERVLSGEDAKASVPDECD